MSNMYITEPNTEGKVLLHTSFGDIDIELWPQQAPKACRNFVQLCLEGYYDNTIFHRVIKDFMVQGGDPTGTGNGGESVYGEPFIDEFHSRLKFNHRGIVAMANENKPNSNHSQFFLTLDACEFLNRKHTIFGKVTGNTIFNLLSVNSLDTDDRDRPLNPPKLLSVEVLWNPFDDVVPRAVSTRTTDSTDAASKKKRERKATSDRKLLSFGDEEDAFVDDDSAKKKKKKNKTMVSSHDLLVDKKLKAQVDEELIHKIKESKADESTGRRGGPSNGSEPQDADTKKRDARASLKAAVAAAARGKPTDNEPHDSDIGEVTVTKSKPPKVDIKDERDEYTRLREELKRDRKAMPVLIGDKARELEKAKAAHDMLTPLQQQRLKYLERKKSANRTGRQQDTLKKLAQFQATLQGVNEELAGQPSNETESYHGQVLEDDDAADDSAATDKSWMAAKLKFKKHIDDQFRSAAGQGVDDYLTIDTRDDKGSRDHRSSDRRERNRDRSRDRERSRSRGRDRRR